MDTTYKFVHYISFHEHALKDAKIALYNLAFVRYNVPAMGH